MKPIKVLDKNDHFDLLLSQIGSTFSVSAGVKVELEEFVCLLYSQKTPQTDQWIEVINFTREMWRRYYWNKIRI